MLYLPFVKLIESPRKAFFDFYLLRFSRLFFFQETFGQCFTNSLCLPLNKNPKCIHR